MILVDNKLPKRIVVAFAHFFFKARQKPLAKSTRTNTIHSFPSLLTVQQIRVIRKVRKTQHQNPEFGHTEGEIKKNLQKSKLAFKGG